MHYLVKDGQNNVYLLRHLFIEKISNEWSQKWKAKHGPNADFNKLKSQNLFLDDLIADIELEIKFKIGLDATAQILIGKDNLRRIFNQAQPSQWKEKTRNTLAYYLGYDGWIGFVNAQHDNIINTNSYKKPKLHKLDAIFFSTMLIGTLFFACSSIYIEYYVGKNAEIEVNSLNPNFPSNVVVNVKSLNDKYLNLSLTIDHEFLEYLKLPLRIEDLSNNYSKNIIFATPGLKRFSLFHLNQKIKEIAFNVITGKQWYAAARIKQPEVSQPFEDQEGKLWYGNTPLKNNTEKNKLTSPIQWTDYLVRIKNEFPNHYLEFPKALLETEKYAHSRVIYFNSQNFKNRMDSIKLNFRAKKTLKSGEDCLSFMMNMIDDKFQRFELYSSNSCDVESNVTAHITQGLNKKQKVYSFVEPKLNGIFEDNSWHNVEIYLLKNHIMITVDGGIYFDKYAINNFGQLRNIYFVFDGNGIIDDVKLTNAFSKELIYENSF